MQSIFGCEAFREIQSEEMHAEVKPMAISREHAGPLERACPDDEGRLHPFHNAITSGKLSCRYRCSLGMIVSQYEKSEEVHLADAYQLALTSGASAPHLRVNGLGPKWTLS